MADTAMSPLPVLHAVLVGKGNHFYSDTWLVVNLKMPVEDLPVPIMIFDEDASVRLQLCTPSAAKIGTATVIAINTQRPGYTEIRVSLRQTTGHTASAYLLLPYTALPISPLVALEQYICMLTEPAYTYGENPAMKHCRPSVSFLPRRRPFALPMLANQHVQPTGCRTSCSSDRAGRKPVYDVIVQETVVGREGYPSTFEFVDAECDMLPGDSIYLRHHRDCTRLLSPRLTIGGHRRMEEGHVEFWATSAEGEIYYIASNEHPLTSMSSQVYFIFIRTLFYWLPLFAIFLLRRYVRRHPVSYGEDHLGSYASISSTSHLVPSSNLVRNYGVIDLRSYYRLPSQGRRNLSVV